MPTYIIPFTKSPSRQNPATFSADMDSRLSEENSRIIAMNAQSVENNTAVTSTSTAAANALAYSNSAATSAATATAAANRAQSVVIPTTAAYAIATQDWRDTMMSKSEFNAMAKQESRNNAGSGAINFGRARAGYSYINAGLYVEPTTPNIVYLNDYLSTPATGTDNVSPTIYQVVLVNGVVHTVKGLNNYDRNNFILPPAPTVLPSTATLTQQQIDSGVIKHADASNSGLIVNGKFDTDTSGWTAKTVFSSTITWAAGEMVCTAVAAYGGGLQGFVTAIGKKYTFEFDMYRGTGTGIISAEICTNTGSSITVLTAIASGTKARYSAEYVAVATTTYLGFRANVAGETVVVDNIAVFPSDAISRSDLSFLESDDYVDVSVNDFVYPLGNKQFLGTTSDCGTTVVGAFAGSATYSLFNVNWQADGALVGRGYVWSTLSDFNKKLFASNPENNCYLDGDKVIQVQYKVIVENGKSDLPLMSQYSFLTNTTTDAGLWYK